MQKIGSLIIFYRKRECDEFLVLRLLVFYLDQYTKLLLKASSSTCYSTCNGWKVAFLLIMTPFCACSLKDKISETTKLEKRKYCEKAQRIRKNSIIEWIFFEMTKQTLLSYFATNLFCYFAKVLKYPCISHLSLLYMK